MVIKKLKKSVISSYFFEFPGISLYIKDALRLKKFMFPSF